MEQFKAYLTETWAIVQQHWWLFPLSLVTLVATGQMGGLTTILRQFLPPVDVVQVLTTYLETNDIFRALAQPAIIEYFEFVLGLVDLSVGEWIPRLALLFTVTLILLTLALLIDGAMIAAVEAARRRDTPVSLGYALREGRKNILHLFLLASVPATPILVTMISLAISLLSFIAANNSGNLSYDATVQATFIALACAGGLLIPAGLFTLIFETLRHFANRACVLEGYRWFKAYGRAWRVLRSQPKPFVMVLLLRAVIGGVVGLLLTLPGLFLLGLPFVWLGNAVLKAYFSTMWTLVWGQTSPTTT